MALRNDESTEQYVSSADSQNHYAHTGDEANSKRTSNSLRYPSTTTSHAVDVPVTNVGINLPADLAVRTYEQFDQMVERGLIYYDKSVEPEWVIDNDGFQFEFRIIPSLLQKPILSADDPRRQSSSKGGPFINPKPGEVIEDHIGSNHRLMLNKYCLYRPMLVVPTRQFAPQSDDLDASDLSAAWALLQAFNHPGNDDGRDHSSASSDSDQNTRNDSRIITTTSGPCSSTNQFVVIFNGGASGGSSQGHKHLQLFPLPENPARRAAMWPEKIRAAYYSPSLPPPPPSPSLTPTQARLEDTIETSIPGVPFRHFGLRIPYSTSPARPVTAQAIIDIHNCLLEAMRNAQHTEWHLATLDYNVALSMDWMVVIPRTWNGGPDGPFGTSAAGMLGLVAVRDLKDRERWAELGYSKFLARLGIPI